MVARASSRQGQTIYEMIPNMSDEFDCSAYDPSGQKFVTWSSP